MYSKKMLKYLFDFYKQNYNKMIVGTSENNIPFYVKQGFDKYEKTIKNFFIDNYTEKIWDGDLQCIDMYYYSKDLKQFLRDTFPNYKDVKEILFLTNRINKKRLCYNIFEF